MALTGRLQKHTEIYDKLSRNPQQPVSAIRPGDRCFDHLRILDLITRYTNCHQDLLFDIVLMGTGEPDAQRLFPVCRNDCVRTLTLKRADSTTGGAMLSMRTSC